MRYPSRRRPRSTIKHHKQQQQAMETANQNLEKKLTTTSYRQEETPTSSKMLSLLPMFALLLLVTSSNEVQGYAFQTAQNRRGLAPHHPPTQVFSPSLWLMPRRNCDNRRNTKGWMAPLLATSSIDSGTGGGNHTMMFGSSSSTAERVETNTDTDTAVSTNSNLKNGDTMVDDEDSVTVNGSRISVDSNGLSKELPAWLQEKVNESMLQKENDTPLPTANGGYTHTSSSKAKISAANKGKTPWNKGKTRSEDVKARIAAGVRKRNRERFLLKLKEQGITEDEYNAAEAKKKAEKEARMKARRTAKGGYRPTEETKAKLSKILKEKWASGSVKKREIDPTKVRRGFKHSEETRAKISASLRKRWADDDDYRANMMNKTMTINSSPEVRRKISETLRKRWQDPNFRAEMSAKMANRPQNTGPRALTHREKISKAIKAKWEDETYRQRATEAMRARQAELMKTRPPKPEPAKRTAPKKKSTPSNATPMRPRLARPIASPKPKVKGVRSSTSEKTSSLASGPMTGQVDGIATPVLPTVKKAKKKKVVKRKAAPKAASPVPTAVPLDPSGPKSASGVAETAKKAKRKKRKKQEPPGSKTRLREERRDLWDLLYGDTEDARTTASTNRMSSTLDDDDNDDDFLANSAVVGAGSAVRSLASSLLGDEDLDDFDPYGLDD